MSENKNLGCCGMDFGRDTVYIDTSRILDCCRDKDCFEDVTVYLASNYSDLLQSCVNVRTKCAEVVAVNIGVDSIPFSPGFYHINIRMFLKIKLEICLNNSHMEELCGLCVLDKSVILYGGEGSVGIFKSTPGGNDFCSGILTNRKQTNLPTAVFEVAAPVILNTKISEVRTGSNCGCGCMPSDIPECVADCFDGCTSFCCNMQKVITVSIGIFSVVRLERPGQYLVSGTEYAVPEKVCPPDKPNDPCDMFRRMSFPVNEFYPPAVESCVKNTGGNICGCMGKNK